LTHAAGLYSQSGLSSATERQDKIELLTCEKLQFCLNILLSHMLMIYLYPPDYML